MQRAYPKNCAVLRMWPSNMSLLDPGTLLSPGHVSLQLFKNGAEINYISFWPGSRKDNEFWSWLRGGAEDKCPCRRCKKTEDHFHRLVEDTKYCGQAKIDDTKIFKTLNIDAMHQYIEKRKSLGLRWTLSASIAAINNERIANCSSLVHDCLTMGGFNQLITNYDRTCLASRKAVQYGKQAAIVVVPVGIALTLSYYLYNGSLVSATSTVNSEIANLGPALVKYGIDETFTVVSKGESFIGSHNGINVSAMPRLGTSHALIFTSVYACGYAALTFMTSAISAIGTAASSAVTDMVAVTPANMHYLIPVAALRDRDKHLCSKSKLRVALLKLDEEVNSYKSPQSNLVRQSLYAVVIPDQLQTIVSEIERIKDRKCSLSDGLANIISNAGNYTRIVAAATACSNLLLNRTVREDKRYPKKNK